VKWARATFLLLLAAGAAAAEATHPLFTDDFEHHAAWQIPGAPWTEETNESGSVIEVDSWHAFSGKQSLHVLNRSGTDKRRGYVAIHLGGFFPQLQPAMFGRVMVFLDRPPRGSPAPQWTLLQGEGRSADDRYNSIYRLGLLHQGGTQFMANFETTPPVRTNCMQQSTRTLPQHRWACVEWHFSVATNELRFWVDGEEITHVTGRATAGDACRGHDLRDEWLAPPRFDSFYLGAERYGFADNDQHLWLDDVALSTRRVGCPVKEK
jgi:hypothetical protein